MTPVESGVAPAPQLPERIRGFPFPFEGDSYHYSANVEPAPRHTPTAAGGWGATILDVDAEYEAELATRAGILATDPSRCGELAHMRPACWDAMLWAMGELAYAHPDDMVLRGDGETWVWHNRLLGIEHSFRYGDDESLPTDPLRYIGAQVQEDLVLLDQREGALWADAGLVTFAADWSLRFDLGMAFVDIHRPVPRVVPTGIIPRAQQFLMRLGTEQAYRRTNWTITATPRLDVSTETYHEWGAARRHVVETGEYGSRLQLRVEVQHFVRLAPSGSLLFTIRTYLLPFDELVRVPLWTQRLASVLAGLPQDLVDYKGLSRFREPAVDWLRAA